MPILQNIAAVLFNGADHWERILHHTTFTPFSVEPLASYVAFYAWIELVVFFNNIYAIANELLFDALLVIISTAFENLADDFGAFDYAGAGAEEFKVLVERHNELLAVAKDINSIYRLPIFVTFLDSTVLLCFLMLQLFSQTQLPDLMKFATYFVAGSLQIFLLCFFCEKIKTASENVGRKLVSGNWHEAKDRSLLRDMQMVLIVAQRPVEMKAFVFFGMKIEVFTQVSGGMWRGLLNFFWCPFLDNLNSLLLLLVLEVVSLNF
jgi:hypothetical protein